MKLDYKRIALCVITGFLSASAFPKVNLFFLIWVAFIPMIFVLMKTKWKSSFSYGFLSGFVFNMTGLYWLIPILHFSTSSYMQAIIASCALWTYLALYWGIWSLCLNLLISKNILKNIFYSNILLAFFASCVWILLEYVRTYLLTGFPWMLIGYSQFKFTEIIQIAEFTGVYGVSFLIIFCNLCLYFWLLREEENLECNNLYLFTVLLLIVGFSIFGLIRANKFRSFGNQEFTVAVVQPNVDQYKKWDIDYISSVLFNLKKYAFEISKIRADLVVWPETVFAGFINKDEYLCNSAKQITNVAGGVNIIGSFYADEKNRYFNVVLAFEDGDCRAVHKKNHLVVFGEFIPFKALFSKFFGVLTQMSDLTKGEDTEVFNNNKISVGSTICSENFLPSISRRFALLGAKVFTNHTNDAWFFDTAAPYQHFIMNVFRAIENRKSVIVSANSGISGIIEASGIIVGKTLPSKEILLVGKFFQNDFKTFYTKYGDLFVGLCAILFLCSVLLRLSFVVFGKIKI
ncbi:MAG: apolipoprotein N-acyltransferase [Endomicrobium sp.]|jgi:apolipoprotein N-acyltransferase|nr:apolipoprotein N-acyltransferase [Endomicrobium sp.]